MHDRKDQLAVLIHEDDLRAQQVGPARPTTAQIGAVTRRCS